MRRPFRCFVVAVWWRSDAGLFGKAKPQRSAASSPQAIIEQGDPALAPPSRRAYGPRARKMTVGALDFGVCCFIAAGDQGARRPGASAALAEGLRPVSAKMVLPVRIELTTSPFVTLALSCPRHRMKRWAFVRWTIPSSWGAAGRAVSRPLDAARLASTPSRRV